MFTFACSSIEGLTLAQKRETIKALRDSVKAELIAKRNAKSAAKVNSALIREAKAAAQAQKMQDKILKAQARLQKLLDKQTPATGSKAIKANKRPSKAVITTAEMLEANEIAEKIITQKVLF